MVVRNVSALAVYDKTFVYSNDDLLAGILVSTECVLGFQLLVLVIIGSYRIPALKSPFGFLMINQNCAQLVACANSGLFYILGVVFNIDLIVNRGNWFGNLSIYLLPVILASFFLMSLNRFCASVFPFKYTKIYSSNKLRFYVIVNWFLPVLASFYLLVARDCTFAFYHFGWVFTEGVRNENCGTAIVFYAMVVQLILCILIFSLDLITLVILMAFKTKIYMGTHSKEVRRREINFGIQVLIQGVVFVMHGFWYDMGYNWIPGDSEKWKIFLTTSFSSNLLHIFDPYSGRVYLQLRVSKMDFNQVHHREKPAQIDLRLGD
ncbi:unnamed protein product [Caenorhabditis sp. 36 PRJEB53466]|nr:unnamed protein product [Caenorhabditis sp. 36 PRJEB53466]